MNAEERLTVQRGVPVPSRPERRVVVHGRGRFDAGLLDTALPDAPEPPPLDAVRTLLAGLDVAACDGVWLWGGEPTLRPDLPHLLRALGELDVDRRGLVTDGLALASDKVAGMVRDLGVTAVRLHLASVRADAHDWWLGQKGSFKRLLRAARALREAGVDLEIDVPVTRPTRPFLPEVAELSARLGARRLWLRRITGRGLVRVDDVAVLARFGLLQGELERAVQLGAREGLEVVVEGFPRCAAPGAAAHLLPVGGVQVHVPDAGSWRFLGPEFGPVATERGCGRCPGPPVCAGAPSDYVRRFDRSEIDSESNTMRVVGELPPTPLLDGSVYPPPRAGRFPASRLAYVRKASQMPSLADDPLVMVPRAEPPASLRVVFLAPSKVADPALGDHPGPEVAEPTRAVRIRLVQAAQHGARTRRVASAGSIAHPEAPALLREAVRLQFEEVEVAGELSAMATLADLKMRRLRGLTRLDAALYSPDPDAHDRIVGESGAFDDTLDLLDRAAGLVPGLSVGTYAVLRSPEDVEGFAQGWADGILPGEPWFRLAPQGGSLSALADVARGIGDEAVHDALAAVLPVALLARRDDLVPAPAAQQAFGAIPSAFAAPSGSDRFGCYAERLADPQTPQPGSCPGYAEGWSR